MKIPKELDFYNHFHPKFFCEDVNDPEATKSTPLRQVAAPFTFPLTREDKNDIIRFMFNYQSRLKLHSTVPAARSLAATQIGISKRMIVFTVPLSRGVIQTFKQTLWLNPTYENVNDDLEVDNEACLSVNMAAPMKRYKRINYKALDTQGNVIEGEAQGVAARVIQHETDHLDGLLITDKCAADKLITIEEYYQRRKARWGGKGWEECIDQMRQEMKDLRKYYPSLTPEEVVEEKVKKEKKVSARQEKFLRGLERKYKKTIKRKDSDESSESSE